MSKTEFNSYLLKAILHVLEQFSDKKIRQLQKKHGGSVKLILNNVLSTRDYAVFYPVALKTDCRQHKLKNWLSST